MSALAALLAPILADVHPCVCSVDYTDRHLIAPECIHHDTPDEAEWVAIRLIAAGVTLAPTPPDNRVAPGQPNPVAPGSQPSATAPATALREALDREQRAWMVHGDRWEDRWEDEEVGSIIDRLRAALEAER